MEESKSIEENQNDFLKLVDDLESLNINIPEEDQAIQILSSLPSKYEQLVHTLKYGSGKDTLTINEVVTSAYSKEIELKEKGLFSRSKADAEGLYVESRGRSDKKGGSNWRGKSKGRGRSQSKPRFNKNSKGCFVCGKEDHWKRDFPERKNHKAPGAANVTTKSKDPMVLTASTVSTEKEWVLYSGCTFHITPDKESLFDLQEFNGEKVLMGNNTHSEVKGIGKLKIVNPDNSVVILTDVRYIPTMANNLISYGQLEKNGCNYEGKDFVVQFYKGDMKIIYGKYKDGLYYLQGQVVRGEAAVVKTSVNLTNRWHSRLGHMSLKCMNILVKKGYLSEKEVNSLDFCETCVLGKSHKQSFSKAKHKSTEVLEYIHSDLWGSPSNEPTEVGCRYFVTYVDDLSKKVWIRFLSSKDEAFEKFAEWKVLVENQTGKKIKCLRTDNGLEFCNKRFDELCKKSGIKRHKTCAYTPQHNGVSERMNRTIIDKVRCMLSETGLQKKFWDHAASTDVYLINRSPNSSIEIKIPEEVWTGSKITFDHIRRFGSVAYVHATQDKTSPRAIKGVFMGYPPETKGYRVWIPDEGICTISRNVVFDEEKVFKDLEASKEVKGNEKSKKKKRVTFSTYLIRGPSDIDTNEGIGPVHGGDSTDQDTSETKSSENSGSEDESQESDSEQETTEVQNLDNYILARDRQRRETKPPSRFENADFGAYALASAEDIEHDEPSSYFEATKSKDWKFWKMSTVEEMDSLKKNDTFEVVEKPKDKQVIGCMWLF